MGRVAELVRPLGMRKKVSTALFLASVLLFVGCASPSKKAPALAKKADHPQSGVFRGAFMFGSFMPCDYRGETWSLEGNLQQLYRLAGDHALSHPPPTHLEVRGDLRNRGILGYELFVQEILVMRPLSENDCK